MEKMKIGIIGCGRIARAAHIPSYLKCEDVEIKYFCDIIPEKAQKCVEKYGCGIAITDYLQREELAVANAVPTAEGALAIAMAEVPYTIHGARCLVLGYGRVAKALAKTLTAVGANVTVAARKPEDLAWIDANGQIPLPFSALTQGDTPLNYDIVFNTVPEQIIGANLLSRLPGDVLLLDLASAPGGFDHDWAKQHGYHVIWALSLPGKTAPVTAGRIISDSIRYMLNEEVSP